MATSQMSELIRHLRGAALPRDGAGPTDGQLLEEYLTRRDEAALTALVRRHAPMVWGVCRRVLGSHHDAEDAFQAVFLVLVRKASSVRPRGMVSNWLYGVARQTALKARSTVNTRRGRERQVAEMPEPTEAEQADWDDLLPLLDEELSRLPDRHRAVVVLCDLEGKTRKEASRRLGVPEGTVAGWLARGRAALAKRLTERGVALSGGALAAVLARNVASAGVPDSVVSATITAASLYAVGRAAAGGLISAKAVALTEGVLRAIMVSKLKAVVAVVMVLGFMATGAAGLVFHKAARSDKPPVAEERVKEPLKEEKGALTAWGEEVGGLQAGLSIRPSEKRAFRHGETVTLLVKVRNAGKEAVKFEYLKQFLDENPPTVTNADGMAVPQAETLVEGVRHAPVKVTLEPGEEIVLETRIHGASGVPYELRPAGGAGKATTKAWPLVVGVGKVTLQYKKVFGNSSAGQIKIDPTLSRLATGKLELEVKDAEQPPQKKDKEALTAWGEEVGSLQAGLGRLASQKRVYSHGETITLLVKVRNVGKEAVKFEYLKQFLDENPPTVTDAAGKAVPQHRTDVMGFHIPVKVTLEPGKEVVLETRMHGASGVPYELSPASGRGKSATNKSPLFAGTGKVVLQYERVLGDTGSGRIKLDPALSKLATGKLELEIKPAAPAEAKGKPVRMQVHVEKVDADARTIAASCLTIGEFDGVHKPLRFENLPVSASAKVVDAGKDIRLADLKPGTGVFLDMEASELTLHVVRIEKVGKPKADGGGGRKGGD